MSLYSKRLERGRFLWPSPADGTVAISAAQLAYMLDGIDWRNPRAVHAVTASYAAPSTRPKTLNQTAEIPHSVSTDTEEEDDPKLAADD